MAREMAFEGAGVPASATRAAKVFPGAKLAPTRGWPKPTRKSWPFSGLMLFTFILFVAPQNLVPALEPLMLAKLAVGVAAVGYVANRAVTGRALTVMTSPVKWALGLAAVAFVSIPAGFWPGGSVDVYLELFGKSLIVFLLVANIVDTTERARMLIGSMIAWGAFAAAHAVVNYVTGRFDPSGQRVASYDSPLAINPNDLALTLNILLGLALGLMPTLRQRVYRVVLGGAMALLVAGIVVSFSRSGFVTLGVLGAYWAARAYREHGGRALVSVALVGLVFLVALPAGYSDRLSTIVHTEEDPTGSADERWQTMVTALGYIAERPVLGYGLGNTLHVTVARGGPSREAHNAYLKLGAELGVIGMVAYILFIVSATAAARAVRRFFQRRHEGWEIGRLAAGVELALIAFAVGALFSPVPYHFYLYYPAGLAVALFTIAARVPASSAVRGR